MKTLFLGCVAMLLSVPAQAADPQPWQLNMNPGVTEFSQAVYSMHMIMFWIVCAIGAVVFGLMFYSIARHRKSLGVTPAQFSHSTKLEVIWTVIPCVILVAMAVPATYTLLKGADLGEYEMTVKITGYQWLWRYDYMDHNVGFVSRLDRQSDEIRRLDSGRDPAEHENYLLDVDRRLVLPVGKRIRFLITADDVIHSWWVPALGWKRDAIPGFVNEAWTLINEPGVYRGQCAELCGKDHGFMPIVVEAVPAEQFDQWVAAQRSGIDGAAQIAAYTPAAAAEPATSGLAPAAAELH